MDDVYIYGEREREREREKEREMNISLRRKNRFRENGSLFKVNKGRTHSSNITTVSPWGPTKINPDMATNKVTAWRKGDHRVYLEGKLFSTSWRRTMPWQNCLSADCYYPVNKHGKSHSACNIVQLVVLSLWLVPNALIQHRLKTGWNSTWQTNHTK